MKDAIIAMLISLGIAKATAEAEAAKMEADPKAVIDIAKLRGEITTGLKDVLKNDPAFVSEFETAAEGKMKGTLERKLKQKFGLTAEAVKDKKFEEIVDIAYEAATSANSTDVKKLQDENIDLKGQIKEYKEVTIPALEKKGDEKAKDFRINSKFEKMIEEMETKEQLRVKKTAAIALAKSVVFSNYEVDEDDDGALVLYQKGKDRKLKAVNKDGSKVLAIGDLLTDTFRENDFLKQSNAPDDPTKKKVPEKKEIDVDGKKDVVNPHLKAAMENAEAMKNIAKTDEE